MHWPHWSQTAVRPYRNRFHISRATFANIGCPLAQKCASASVEPASSWLRKQWTAAAVALLGVARLHGWQDSRLGTWIA